MTKEPFKRIGGSGSNNFAWKGGAHTYTCSVCGKDFKRLPCYIARSIRNGSKFIACSGSCVNRVYKKQQVGAKNPAWRGGINKTVKTCPACKITFEAKPKKIYCSKTCYAEALTWGKSESRGKRQFKTYRAIVETILERSLESNEVVHHANGDHTDNRPENLVVMTAADHTRMHVQERVTYRKAVEQGEADNGTT